MGAGACVGAARIAALNLKLTSDLASLVKWLEAAQALPPARKAAALLAADVVCAKDPGCAFDAAKPRDPIERRLVALGYRSRPFCGDTAYYTRSWLQHCERLDPTGPAGEMARLADLEKCQVGDGMEAGEKFLTDFPASKWAPYAHYVLGRLYDERLALALYGRPEGGDPVPLTRARLIDVRQAAIDHFRAFLDQAPGAVDVPFVRQETWRLLAGLPPTLVQFGCDCE